MSRQNIIIVVIILITTNTSQQLTLSRSFPGGASGKESTHQYRRCKRHGFESLVRKIPCRRNQQPSAAFLPGISHGQRSVAGCSPQGPTGSDTTEATQHRGAYHLPDTIMFHTYHPIIDVQSLSHVLLFATPWTAAHQTLLSSTISQSLLKFTSVELVVQSSHLILCCPLLLLPSIFPSFRVFSNESSTPSVCHNNLRDQVPQSFPFTAEDMSIQVACQDHTTSKCHSNGLEPAFKPCQSCSTECFNPSSCLFNSICFEN